MMEFIAGAIVFFIGVLTGAAIIQTSYNRILKTHNENEEE